MGQATVDLPDPLDTPAPDTLAGTDDLLAQIAGDEIDRLIAESQDERGPSAPRGPSSLAARDVVEPAPSTVATAVAAPVPASTQAVAAATSVPPTVPPRTPVDGIKDTADAASTDAEGAGDVGETMATLSPAALEADAELDKLLEEMSQAERGVAPPEPAPAAATSDAPGAPRTFASDASAAPAGRETDLLMSPEEREALKLAAIGAETDAAEEHDTVAAAAAQEGSGPRPLPVAVLEMINAPLSFMPDGLRDALGKVAILTLVNSLAVLIYVLFIRR